MKTANTPQASRTYPGEQHCSCWQAECLIKLCSEDGSNFSLRRSEERLGFSVCD